MDEVLPALSVPRPNLANVVVPRLVDAMAAADRPFVLVLDDLDAVDDASSFGTLGTIAQQLPPSVQLALSAHSEPPIGVAGLRAQRRLLEIHTHDLVMTRSEAAELLEAAGVDLGPGAVKRLVERTEGWPAALYLATLALEGESDPASAIERFAGDDRLVADYLREEFLSLQSAGDLEFLTATSILERLNGPLCDAVLEREGSAETLRRLSRSNLLVVPLDRNDEEYRYHSLLRQMLEAELRRLGERTKSRFHDRASRWYAEQGDFDHAIPHAISAGNLGDAGTLIWMKTAEYESGGREATVRRWLDRFTDDQAAASPQLSLARAANNASRGDGAQSERWTSTAIRAAAGAPKRDRDLIEVSAALIRAASSARGDVNGMADDARRAYELLPEDSPWRSLCCLLQGVAHHLTTDRAAARAMLDEASRRAAVAAPNIHTLALAQLAILDLDERDDEAAAARAIQAATEANRLGLQDYPTSALVFAVSALTCARRGRVEDATRQAKRAARLLAALTDFSFWYEAETRIVLGRALGMLDDVPAARNHLADATRWAKQSPDSLLLEEWLAEAMGEIEAITELSGQWPLTKAELRLLHLLPTHLTFREVGEKLFISTNTVKTQARAIYRKLGVSSRAEAVACAEAAGLIHHREDARASAPADSPSSER